MSPRLRNRDVELNRFSAVAIFGADALCSFFADHFSTRVQHGIETKNEQTCVFISLDQDRVTSFTGALVSLSANPP